MHAKDLQPQQAALLAALVQNPTAYDPVQAPEGARWSGAHLVLGKLLEQGYIDAFEYQLADSKPLLPKGRPIGFPPEKKTIANYFVDYVRQQLINLYGRQKALGGGLRVYTTLNPRMQRLALKAVRSTLPKRRPEAALVAINPPTGEVKAMVGGRDYTNTVYGKFNLATDARAPAGLVVQDVRAARGARGGHPPADAVRLAQAHARAAGAGRSGRCRTTRAPTAATSR